MNFYEFKDNKSAAKEEYCIELFFKDSVILLKISSYQQIFPFHDQLLNF
jgi:hypothetical protein